MPEDRTNMDLLPSFINDRVITIGDNKPCIAGTTFGIFPK